MPKYRYTAKSFKGNKEEGYLVAKDKFSLAHILKHRKLILVYAEQIGVRARKKTNIKISFSKHISMTDKLMFARNLGVMTKAGISLPKALETLSIQTKNKHFTKILLEIRDKIVRGENFSNSLNDYPSAFSELFVNMIKVGEKSGTLEEVLAVLAKQISGKKELNSKIQGALIYPAVVIFAMIGIAIAMLIFVVPSIATTFEELETSLPATTQLVINLGTALSQYWYVFVIILISLPVAFSQLLKTKQGKRAFSFTTLKVPVVSLIIKKMNSARIARILSSLISAGVSLTSSLGILSRTLSNLYYKEAIEGAIRDVKKGVKLSESLGPHKDIFSPLLIQMISVGEETGQTSSVLEELAGFLEEEVTGLTNNLASLLEPVIMLLVGGAVGFFAISMVQPMYSMLGAIE